MRHELVETAAAVGVVLALCACGGRERAPDDAGGDAGAVIDGSGARPVDGMVLSAGGNGTCVRISSGAVLCWGALQGGGEPSAALAAVPGITDAVAVSVGYEHACALRVTGGAVCWGANGSGQLGDGTTADPIEPVAVSSLSRAIAISSGREHTCALRVTGEVVCWGANGSGQLGDGSGTDQLEPVAVSGLTDAVAISAGNSHTCAVRAEGTVACWGANHFAVLGAGAAAGTTPDGRPADFPSCPNGFETPGGCAVTPVGVSGLGDAVAVSAGISHSCAVRTTGAVVCWGDGRNGQLGDGLLTHFICPRGTPDRPDCVFAPVGVVGVTDAVEVAVGYRRSCARRATGAVVCWGSNDQGLLGDGVASHSVCEQRIPRAEDCALSPVAVTGLTDATGLAAGELHTCVSRASGSAVCWGINNWGQLGDGTFDSSTVPVAVALP